MSQKTRSRVSLRRRFLVLAAIAVLAATLFLDAGNTAYAQSPADGETIFAENCVACHSTGADQIVGPGLAGIADRTASDDYIRESIVDPGAFVVEGFQNIMPSTIGDSLSSGDLDDLVAYLGTLSASGAGSPEPELISAPASTGDRDRGENLFAGPRRLENDGPACSACHSAGGFGALGGGSLGPDLTNAYAKLGDAMILFPETSKTMKPIFTERPLTDQEKADLLEFFKTADISERDTAQVIQLFGVSVAGLVIIAVFTQLIWRRRLRGVRKPMVGTNALTSEPQGNKLKRLLTSLFWQESAS